MGKIRFFELGEFVGGELDVDGGDGVGEVVGFGGADDGGGDEGFGELPSQCDLGHGEIAGGGEGGEFGDDGGVGFDGALVDFVAELVGAFAWGGLVVGGAGEAAAGEGAPGDDADAFGFAEGHHLALFFAVEKVVVILHGDEFGPAVGGGEVEGFGELPGEHGGGADVAGFSCFDNVVERFEGFFDGGLVVPAVDLIEVDVVGAEAAEGVVDFGEDGFAREAGAVGVRAHAAVDFGGEDDLVAGGEVFEGAAGDFFAGAVGVDVGGVEEIDAGVDGGFEEGAGLVFGQAPGMNAAARDAIAHAAEADLGDFEAGVSESCVFHDYLRECLSSSVKILRLSFWFHCRMALWRWTRN